MDIQIVIPTDTGELLAFIAALLTALTGAALMVMPRRLGAAFGLAATRPDGMGELRGPFGGLLLGVGLAAVVLAQPLVYLALGAGFLFAAVGRIVSVVVDGARTMQTLVAFGVEAVLAFILIAYPFGMI